MAQAHPLSDPAAGTADSEFKSLKWVKTLPPALSTFSVPVHAAHLLSFPPFPSHSPPSHPLLRLLLAAPSAGAALV